MIVILGATEDLVVKEIDWDQTIHQLAQAYPELPAILYDLGFTEITKPGMIHTAGRFVTLRQGCSMRKINRESVKIRFQQEGFVFKEE